MTSARLSARCLKVESISSKIRDAANANRQLKYPARVGTAEPVPPVDQSSGNQLAPPRTPRTRRLMGVSITDLRKPHDDNRGEDVKKSAIEQKIDQEID